MDYTRSPRTFADFLSFLSDHSELPTSTIEVVKVQHARWSDLKAAADDPHNSGLIRPFEHP